MSDAIEFSPGRDEQDEHDHQLIRAAIRTLSTHLSQRKLERLLGLSQGYLSRIASGAGTASRPLMMLLCLLAARPKERLAELTQLFFGEPPKPRSHSESERAIPEADA